MITLAILDKKSAAALDRRIKAQAARPAPVERKYVSDLASSAYDDEAREPRIVGTVTVVPPGMRRVRAVVIRTCREQAIVEFDMPETADQYSLGEELLEAIPPTAWVECQTDSGYAYIDRITDVSTTKSAITGQKLHTMDNTEGLLQEDLDQINEAYDLIAAEFPDLDSSSINDALNQAWAGQASSAELATDAAKILGVKPESF